MKVLFAVGLILLILGVASLFIPFPVREKHDIKAGGIRMGIETVERQKVHPAVSAVLIGGGVVLMIAGTRRRLVR